METSLYLTAMLSLPERTPPAVIVQEETEEDDDRKRKNERCRGGIRRRMDTHSLRLSSIRTALLLLNRLTCSRHCCPAGSDSDTPLFCAVLRTARVLC